MMTIKMRVLTAITVLVAFGTRRSTLSGSVLYQMAVPVLLGLVLAVATGTGLGAILQAAAGAPIRFDWFGIGATSIGATEEYFELGYQDACDAFDFAVSSARSACTPWPRPA